MKILGACFNSFLVFLLVSTTEESSEKNQLQLGYEAIYELTFQPSTVDVQDVRKENMYLFLGDEHSVFASAGKIIEDSILANRANSQKSRANFARMMAQIPKTEFQYSIYKGVPEEKMTVTDEIFKDEFRYEETKNLFDWEINSEIKEIAGYSCQKATTSFAGRNYIAWFTMQIPISEGPYKFNGLPGLIVKVHDEENHYNFELKQFRKLKEPKLIEVPGDKFIVTNKRKLTELKEEDKRNPMRAVESSGIEIGFTDAQKKELTESRMKKNNPIELE